MNPLGAMHTPPPAIRFLGTNGWYDSETGNTVCTLISALSRTARNQENDLAATIGLLVGLFEPFMLVFMGAVVLVIVLAILLPILSLNQLVG